MLPGSERSWAWSAGSAERRRPAGRARFGLVARFEQVGGLVIPTLRSEVRDAGCHGGEDREDDSRVSGSGLFRWHGAPARQPDPGN